MWQRKKELKMIINWSLEIDDKPRLIKFRKLMQPNGSKQNKQKLKKFPKSLTLYKYMKLCSQFDYNTKY